MRVLVDTSVWAEFFRSKPSLARAGLDALGALIEDNQVVTIFPIEAEVLSGRIAKPKENEVRRAFVAIDHVDADWNVRTTWDRIVQLARTAQDANLPVLGIVDRMILLAAETHGVSIWTLEHRLARVATARGIPGFAAGST
jgi:predicted nucleic acid-binding protein